MPSRRWPQAAPHLRRDIFLNARPGTDPKNDEPRASVRRLSTTAAVISVRVELVTGRARPRSRSLSYLHSPRRPIFLEAFDPFKMAGGHGRTLWSGVWIGRASTSGSSGRACAPATHA